MDLANDTDSYEADIRWTTHGVPHVRANDWGGLGFGQGFACARDRLVTLADHVLKVRSERSRFLGAGPGDAHLHSDLGYLGLGVASRAARMAASQPAEIVALVSGYAAGVNAWLEECDRSQLPAWCRDAQWIRPVSAADLFAVYVDMALFGSGRNLAGYIGSARPPEDGVPAAPPPLPPGGELVGEPEMGSNGWAFGGSATDNGRGMVMANPHFPWHGEGKLWECHLQLPGELDVYGAALVGCPGVQIGFNQNLAWTHTFSKGNRFTVYRIDLDPDEPTRYVHRGVPREMERVELSVEVLVDGELQRQEFARYSTHHGPMLDLPFLGWANDTGFTYRDANIDNDWFLAQVLAQCQAHSVAELRSCYERVGGLPWVNTLAADDTGRCWYIDSSSTPNLSPEAQKRYDRAVVDDPLTALLATMRVALLDGSSGDDDWVDVDEARAPGLVPFHGLPQCERDDHVFNANDPYWLANRSATLARHSPMHGLFERPVSARTRMNALLVAGDGPVQPSGANGGWGLGDLERLVLGNHSLPALQLRREVVERLRGAADSGSAEIAERLTLVADVLQGWNGCFDLDEPGAPLWRELLGGFDDAALTHAGPLWAHGWDPAEPVTTPRGLAEAPADGDDPVVAAALGALDALSQAGFAGDATLRDCQWASRGSDRVAVSGGCEVDGVANVAMAIGALARADLDPAPQRSAPIAGRLERTGLAEGGYQITYGASFVMAVGFDDDGPQARGLLVYGQADDVGSPHHSDQVVAFAEGVLRPLAFTEAQIESDPALRRRVVRSG